MTSEQEAIAEKILQDHKNNNGYLDWSAYYEEENLIFSAPVSYRHRIDILNSIKFELAEKCLIEIIPDLNRSRTCLTPKGAAFKAFGEERRQIARNKRERRASSSPMCNLLNYSLLTASAGAILALLPGLIKKVSKLKQQ